MAISSERQSRLLGGMVKVISYEQLAAKSGAGDPTWEGSITLGKRQPEAAPDCDTGAVARWLTDGARSAARPEQVMAQLCEHLVALGIPLWRTALFVRTLHPAVMGRRLTWRPDIGVHISLVGFEMLETDAYLTSPVVHVYSTGVALRRCWQRPIVPPTFQY
jgi:hypothetical protein